MVWIFRKSHLKIVEVSSLLIDESKLVEKVLQIHLLLQVVWQLANLPLLFSGGNVDCAWYFVEFSLTNYLAPFTCSHRRGEVLVVLVWQHLLIFVDSLSRNTFDCVVDFLSIASAHHKVKH